MSAASARGNTRRTKKERYQPGLCRYLGGFFGGFARFLEDFAFGADPVFQGIAGSAVALEVDFIGALRDFFLWGKFFGGRRITFRR